MTAAINFDGHRAETDQPVGIDVATREFLRAYFRFANQKQFYTVCPDDTAFGLFRDYAGEENIDPERCVSINQNDATGLEEAGCLVRYDPGIVKFSWARRHHDQRRYSLCGIAHASASAAAMEMFGDYFTAPLQNWDALICPSRSIRSAVQAVIDGWRVYMKDRFAIEAHCPLELPVIPLGVDSVRFDRLSELERRTEQREKLGVAEDEVVILYVGRLNYLAKANPLPLLLAAEEIAGKSATPVRVVFNGYFNDEMNKTAFKQAVQKVNENAQVNFIRHGDSDYPDGFWAGADIFCSLSDNIQESFGLTPIEAMAASLPVVVSDWDGYRDTVRDGDVGFTVPTLAPPPGSGADMAYGYFAGQLTYGDYLGGVSQSTSVDVGQLVKALMPLIENPDLRLKMGRAGRQEVMNRFEWSRIIRAYEELWQELSMRRREADEIAAPSQDAGFHPSFPDPLTMFESFPTRHLAADGKITLLLRDWQQAVVRVQLKMGLIYPETLIPLEELPVVFGHLEMQESCTLQELADAMGAPVTGPVMMTAGWLIKLGICGYTPPEAN